MGWGGWIDYAVDREEVGVVALNWPCTLWRKPFCTVGCIASGAEDRIAPSRPVPTEKNGQAGCGFQWTCPFVALDEPTLAVEGITDACIRAIKTRRQKFRASGREFLLAPVPVVGIESHAAVAFAVAIKPNLKDQLLLFDGDGVVVRIQFVDDRDQLIDHG